MANFMGPMAPPQAAPNAPPQLDIRTNPSQRAQFKEFMQGMNRPVMPPTTAPIAPMLPAPMPSPMDQVDIFAPVPMANGGVADPYAMEGKIGQSVGPKMVGGTTNVIDASGGDDVGPMGGDAMEALVMENKNFPPLPVTGFPAATSKILSELPNVFGSYDYFGNSNPQSSGVMSPQTIGQRLNDIGRGILGATQMDGPMGSTFGIRPVARDGNLGIMANFTVPFEDGGPVRMFMGGDPQAYGEERGRQDTSETAQERQRVGGTTNVFEGDSSPREERDETERRVNEAVAATQQAEDKGQFFEDAAASQNPVDLTFGAPRTDTSGSFTGTDTDEFFANQNMAADQRLDDAVKSILAVDKTEQFDDLLSDVFVSPSVDPMTDPYRGMGAGDFDFGPALPRDADIINNLLNRRVNYTTRSGNVIDRTVQDDLIERGKPSGLPGFIGKGLDILGANKAGKYLDQIAGGAPGVIDASTGQLVGYVGEGFIKGSQVFSGRPGYNPFTGDAQNVKFDPSTNSYIVTPGQPNQGEDDQQRNRASGQTPSSHPLRRQLQIPQIQRPRHL